jgi:hypothetical protein
MTSFGWYRPWLADVQDSDLSMKAKALASVLARDERDGAVRRTAGWLAPRCSCDERTVRRAVAELAAGEWITTKRARDHLIVSLVPRPDTVPDQDEIGQDARSRSDTESAQTGHSARADRTQSPRRPDTESDIPTRATSSLPVVSLLRVDEPRGSTARRDVDQVFGTWVTATERDASKTKLTPDRRRRIERAIGSHGLDDCLAAVRHIGADDWARGKNDRGRRFDDIKHALGDAERIERWRDRTPRAANAPSQDFSKYDRGMIGGQTAA